MKNGTIWQHIYSIENARKFKNTAFLKSISFFPNKSFKGLKNFSERHCEVKKDFRLTCSTCRGSPLSPHRRSDLPYNQNAAISVTSRFQTYFYWTIQLLR